MEDELRTAEVAVEVPAKAPARWIARLSEGERYIGRMLRGGAIGSGALFVASIALRAFPHSSTASVAVSWLEEGAISLLLMTPVARLIAGGAMLGLRGEWRYALYAGGVLILLALAVGAGLRA